jgi:hypothetical protein
MSDQEVGPIAAMLETWIGEHVAGYSVDVDGATYYPVVRATRPGCGDISRWLDGLPKDKTIKFPTVISRKLEAMLVRRGFTLVQEWDEHCREMADVYVRPATTPIADKADREGK